MDRIHRHKRRLSPCPDAQGRQKVSAIQSEQEDLAVYLSTFSDWQRSMVEAARCQAARQLGRLADLC